jgi:DNA-binding CsgD family transcriptional regulator
MGHQTIDHRKQQLGTRDVREMLRLYNELHNAGDENDARKLKLLEGIRRLTDADGASASVATFIAPGGKPSVVSVVNTGRAAVHLADPRKHAGKDDAPWDAYHNGHVRAKRPESGQAALIDWCAAAYTAERRSPRATDHRVHSFLPLADDEVVACLTIRRAASRPKFLNRERAIVCTFHTEVGWIYRPDVIMVSPDTRSLSRRERETLQHLLAGKGEKQIAAAMGLSYNTIHHYVKALHRHFAVSSRSELLARWVGR